MSGGGEGQRGGRPDHDSTARRGIMDTIIRERLEVLVIFLLPHLTRALVRVVGQSSRQANQHVHGRDTNCLAVDRDLRDGGSARSRIKKRSRTVEETMYGSQGGSLREKHSNPVLLSRCGKQRTSSYIRFSCYLIITLK